jgi:hypothetical protein
MQPSTLTVGARWHTSLCLGQPYAGDGARVTHSERDLSVGHRRRVIGIVVIFPAMLDVMDAVSDEGNVYLIVDGTITVTMPFKFQSRQSLYITASITVAAWQLQNIAKRDLYYSKLPNSESSYRISSPFMVSLAPVIPTHTYHKYISQAAIKSIIGVVADNQVANVDHG